MRINIPRHILSIAALATVFVCRIEPVYAQNESNPINNLSIHGYLTQAYGESDKLPIYGLTKTGSLDYRVFAIQMRYSISDDDQVVVQLRNRRIGTSLVGNKGVEPDWLYYVHDFGTITAKIGRVPLSYGIYNETRNVGTLIPFFRAPPTYYIEGTETITGAFLSNRKRLGNWALESTVYMGEMEFPVQIFLPTEVILFDVKTTYNYGGSIFLETPIQGLRAGIAALSVQFPIRPTDTTRIKSLGVSVDGTFNRFLVRTEYQRYVVPRFSTTGDENVGTYYVQASANVIGGLWVSVQHEYARFDLDGDSFVNADDRAIGISYKFSANLVAKIEGHKAAGYNMDRFNPRPLLPGKTNYGLASLSVSF